MPDLIFDHTSTFAAALQDLANIASILAITALIAALIYRYTRS